MSLKLRSRQLISLLALLLWTGFIWSQSLKVGAASSALSDSVVREINLQLFDLSFMSPHMQTFIVRKLAHFSEYFILGVLISWSKAEFQKVLSKYRKYIVLVAGLYTLLIPILDELLQTFVPGRDGNIRDVFIDLCGALFAYVFIALIQTLKRNKE